MLKRKNQLSTKENIIVRRENNCDLHSRLKETIDKYYKYLLRFD